MLIKKKAGRTGTRGLSRNSLRPMLEAFEKRELLTGTGFLQGTVFADPTGNGVLSSSTTPLANATVNLFALGNPVAISSVTTQTDGNYFFGNLTPGTTYSLVETPPTNYSNTGSQAFSQIDKVGATTSSSIQVTAVDSTKVSATYQGFVNNPSHVSVTYTLGSSSVFPSSTADQLIFNLTGDPNVNTGTFNTFCVDAGDTLTKSSTFTSLIDPQSAMTNGGQVGYLFNHYGLPGVSPTSFPTTLQSNNIQSLLAGVQIAIWDLEYNNGAASSPTGFNISTINDPTVQGIANSLVSDAFGKSEKVAIIDASLTGMVPSSSSLGQNTGGGAQSVLAAKSFDFFNKQTLGSVSGFVYADGNNNGLKDAGEIGIANVPLTLSTVSNGNSTPIATTTSAADGSYTFDNLSVGTNYQVTVTQQPAGYIQGQNSVGNMVQPVSTGADAISPITVTAGQNTANNNFGEVKPVTLTGTVYADNDNSTTLTPGDTGIGGVTVTLSNASGTVATTTTAANGTYSFTTNTTTGALLPPGTYKISEAQPANYLQGSNTVGALTTSPNTPDGSLVPTDMIGSIKLTQGQSSVGNNFGELGSLISGIVYVDATGNGLTANNTPPVGSGDTLEQGVTVTLTQGNTVIATAVTGANGAYAFPGLPFGNYTITETVPTGQIQTGPNSLIYTITTSPAVPSSTGDNFSNYMACNTSVVSGISYTVVTNGVSKTVTDLRNNTSPGSIVTANFTVAVGATTMLSLVDYSAPAGTYSSSTASQQVLLTNATGTFGAGPHSLTLTLPNSFYQVDFVCGAAINTFGPSGSNVFYGAEGRLFSADNGGTQAYAPSTISGTVYADGNTNDTFDTGDTGIGGVTVYLYNGDYTVQLASKVTAANGFYSFGNLAPGSYSVSAFSAPGYTGETPNPGVNGGTPTFISSTGLSAIKAITLSSNTTDTGNNFGNIGSSISGTVYVDATGGGLTPANTPPVGSGDTGEAGVTVNLKNSSGVILATTTTGANGTYSFTGLPYGTYTVAEVAPGGQYQTGPNSVTYNVTTSAAAPTSTNDNFANYMACSSTGLNNVKYFVNGVQVSGLFGHGAQGATVTVTFNVAAGSAPIQLSLAAYEAAFPYFTIYNVSQQVLVGDQTGTFGPGNYSLTVTLPNSYYQVDFVCGLPITTFGPGGSNVDYGEEGRFIDGDIGGTNPYTTSTLSGNVFVDTNGNGSFGTGDLGLGSIPLTLTGTTLVGATIINGVLTPVPVTATTTSAANGSYSFAGLAPGTYTVTETQPANYSAEVSNPGSVGGTSGVGVISKIFLNSNTAATGYNFGEIGTSISGFKYNDTTGNGLSTTNTPLTGDIPLAGVTINLYNSNGSVIATSVTGSNGGYSFTGVPYGKYYVAEVVPAGQIQTGPTYVGTTSYSCPVLDCGFEGVPTGWGSYLYNPVGTGWSYSGQSGVTGNGSGFTSGNSSAPQGNQVGFLQSLGSFSQVVSNWSAGTYQLSFSTAQRASWGGSHEDFQVLVDGQLEGTYNPTSTSYQTCVTLPFTVGAGSHTISFKGLNSWGGDNTCFFDNVCVTQNTGTATTWTGGQDYYAVSLTATSPNSVNNNFSDFTTCNKSAITNVSYKTNASWWSSNTLNNYTKQGNTVCATFTVTGSTNQTVSLVSYVIPNCNVSGLAQQVEYSLATGSFTPGTHTVSITLPNGYYQVDFVCGAAISQFGPSSSNVSYSGEGRLISSDTDGWNVAPTCTPPLANVLSDIGNVGTPGTESYINGTYSLTSSGADYWGTADGGSYVYQTLNGDGELVARVTGLSYTDSWAKAGLQIRQSLDAGSAQASVFASAGNGVVFQDRTSAGANSNNWAASNSYGCSSTSAVYLKLVRSGNTISSYDSSNGLNWTLVGTDTVNMTQQVYIGLALSSHNTGAVATATFDSVSTTGYWSSCSGQSLIQSCGGWSGSTSLSSWLAACYPNLYGSNAGCNNLWGMSNNSVASFCQTLQSQCGSESLECQTLSSALEVYFTSNQWGGNYGKSWGFNTSYSGLCGNTVSLGGNSDAFGGCSSSSVWNLLASENSQACGGILYAGNASRHQMACNVIYQVSNSCY